MENYAIFVVEGKNVEELRRNFNPVISDFLDYDVTYNVKENKITFEKKDTIDTLTETYPISIFNLGTFLMMVLPVKMGSVSIFFKNGGERLKNKLITITPFKSLVFIANKSSLIGEINTLAYNVVQDYKKKLNGENIQFSLDLLPIYINDVDRDYKIPIAIYDQFHVIYNKISAVLKESQ